MHLRGQTELVVGGHEILLSTLLTDHDVRTGDVGPAGQIERQERNPCRRGGMRWFGAEELKRGRERNGAACNEAMSQELPARHESMLGLEDGSGLTHGISSD